MDRSDRRINSKPVSFERRSNIDRREKERPTVDLKVKWDLESIKKTFAPFIKDDTFEITSKKEFKSAKITDNIYIKGALSAFPIARRLSPIQENTDDNNTFKTVGLAGLAAINLKEDYRDILTVLGRTETTAKECYYSRFKFFAGTSFENFLLKSSFGEKIFNGCDITLADTKFSKKKGS